MGEGLREEKSIEELHRELHEAEADVLEGAVEVLKQLVDIVCGLVKESVESSRKAE